MSVLLSTSDVGAGYARVYGIARALFALLEPD
jgi:hypothetical protein